MTLHADVLALQDRWGISYKDASHRLYMAEVEKLKVNAKCHKAVENVASHAEDVLKNIMNELKKVANADGESVDESEGSSEEQEIDRRD